VILDRLPRPLLRFIIKLYQKTWYHWFASILLGFWDTLFGVIYRSQEWLFHTSLWKEWQNRPSPKFPLARDKDDLPIEPERYDACGQFIATMIATYADATELQALLPPDAELDPAHIHDGKHAIIHMLGYTQNLRRVWNPLPGINYMEFAVGIPSVRINRKGGYDFPFFYLPTLYLSRFYPVAMGLMVGYRKHWGWVSAKDKTYKIATLGGRKILSANFEVAKSPDGTLLPPLVMGGENAVHWRDLLNQPHANPFGPDEFLYLHYHWDWNAALLQPVTAEVEIFEALPGLHPGKYSFEPLDMGAWLDGMAPTGAFRLCAPFELLPPFDRKALHKFRMMMDLEPAQGTAAVSMPEAGVPPAA
jgi:hypothetical protein